VRRLNWILAVVSMLSTAIATWLWIDLRNERDRTLALQSRLTLIENVHEPPRGSKASTALPATVAPTIAADPPAATKGDPPAAMHVYLPSADDEIARQRKLLTDPKYRDAWHEQRRAVYALRRDNLVRIVGLTPEQADAVLDLQIDREQSRIENPGVPSRAQEQADDAADQQRLREMLGDLKTQQLQKYMESRATRARVDDFRSVLSGADALREDQVEPLIDALHVEDARMQQEMQEYRSALMNAGEPDARRQLGDRQIDNVKASYERMHSAAAPLLTSSQLDKLDAMLKRDLDRRVAEQRINRVQSQFDDPALTKTGSD
jgi:hypothetical protein